MAEITLREIEQLADQLLPEDQQKLIDRLTKHLIEKSARRWKSNRERERIQADLNKAWGAWGNKTADEIDREIEEMRRKDWSRDWPRER